MRFKIAQAFRRKGTFSVIIYDKLKNKIFAPVIQFSFKNPWWIPKLDKEYFKKLGAKHDGEGYGWLAGWIFFYIGICITENN